MRQSVKVVTNELNFKFRVAGLIIKDNKVLLVKMDKANFWCLPGGYVELGETTIAALKRELKEEIQKDFIIDKYLGVMENFFINKYDQNIHEISFYYLASCSENISSNDFQIVENDKGHIVNLEFKWQDIEELDNYNIKPEFIKE